MSNQSSTAPAGKNQEFDLVVRGERILTGEGIGAHEVGIRDGRIAAIEGPGQGLVGRETIELGAGEVMIPGLVDSHV
ncbi:MAG: allantoinase AllB, partial [Micrococcaceae bacterium]|nr:allantoinase AllB [Micrococcaceae bacterium]